MVRAILDGSKTQTRRIMTHQPGEDWSPTHYTELHGYDKDGALTPDKVIGWGAVDYDGERGCTCPHGKPGDLLWVRETHYIIGETGEVFYKATGDSNKTPPMAWTGKWKPSIFMPRSASRITLEITDVRVERLQEISRGDAMAEGCPHANMANESSPVYWYSKLWGSINGADSWNANPWVWVIEFKKILVLTKCCIAAKG